MAARAGRKVFRHKGFGSPVRKGKHHLGDVMVADEDVIDHLVRTGQLVSGPGFNEYVLPEAPE